MRWESRKEIIYIIDFIKAFRYGEPCLFVLIYLRICVRILLQGVMVMLMKDPYIFDFIRPFDCSGGLFLGTPLCPRS